MSLRIAPTTILRKFFVQNADRTSRRRFFGYLLTEQKVTPPRTAGKDCIRTQKDGSVVFICVILSVVDKSLIFEYTMYEAILRQMVGQLVPLCL